jgi:hypothetical protein
MFRSAVVRSLRASVPRAIKPQASFQIRSSPIARPAQFAPRFALQAVRLYSAPAGLSKDEIEGRIVNLLKNFDKVRQTAPLECFIGLQSSMYEELITDVCCTNRLPMLARCVRHDILSTLSSDMVLTVWIETDQRRLPLLQ